MVYIPCGETVGCRPLPGHYSLFFENENGAPQGAPFVLEEVVQHLWQGYLTSVRD